MRTATLIVVITCLLRPAICSPPLTSLKHVVRRNVAEDDIVILSECIGMTSSAGHYVYVSPGRQDVCGLFIVGSFDQVVALEFTDFNVQCDDGGIVAVFDGWEVDGQVFPSVSDHSLSLDERYRGFCGDDQPTSVMVMSQNVALIQFRIPRRLQNFGFRISFRYNPAPCNVVSTTGDGSATLSNYGLHRNCSLLFVYPEVIDIIRLDVGQVSLPRTRASSAHLPTTVTRHPSHLRRRHTCVPGGRDYVEVLGGSSLDTSVMTRFTSMCGLRARQDDVVNRAIRVSEQYTAIRLVSSGRSYNRVTVLYQRTVTNENND